MLFTPDFVPWISGKSSDMRAEPGIRGRNVAADIAKECEGCLILDFRLCLLRSEVVFHHSDQRIEAMERFVAHAILVVAPEQASQMLRVGQLGALKLCESDPSAAP